MTLNGSLFVYHGIPQKPSHKIGLLLTHIVKVEGQVLVLEEGVVVEAASLDLLEEGADIPAVQHL